MHYRSFKFVSKHKFTAKTVSLITGRDNVNNHHRHPKPWLTQLMLMALITLPQQSNAADLATSDQATQAQRAVVFNIPRQAADDSLPVFGQQADVTVIYPFEWVKDHHTNRLQGEYSVTHAVAILLDNTGLQAQFSPEGHLVITQVDETKGKNMNTNKRKTVLATMVGLFAAGGMTTAAAQESMGESARAQRALDEIIVTAEKREASMQRVPISITALTGEQLEKSGITNSLDLEMVTPGLSFASGARLGRVFIRGIGSTSLEGPGSDPSASVYVNGVYQARFIGSIIDLLDVERVEVLKGPQGTLYGRNSTGGAIKYTTNSPENEFGGKVSAEFGNYEHRKFTGLVDIPLISDELLFRGAVMKMDRDGYMENIVTPEFDVDKDDLIAGHFTVKYMPSETVDITVHATAINDDGDHSARKQFIVPGSGLSGAAQIIDDPRKTVSNWGPSESPIRTRALDLNVSWDIGFATLNSITAYNDVSMSPWREDGDATELSVLHQGSVDADGLSGDSQAYSQEFVLTSNEEGAFDWTAGLYFFDEEAFWLGGLELGSLSFFSRIRGLNRTEAYAAFGNINYHLTEKLRLNAGVRYSNETKEYTVTNESNFVVGPTVKDEESWNEWTPKIGLDYLLSDDSMVYGSISKGFKSGAFNFGDGSSVDPEFITAYEIGVKSMLLDDRVRLNVSAFHYDYEDLQVLGFDQPSATTVLSNAAEADIDGLELSSSLLFGDALKFDLGLSFLDAEYKDFLTQENGVVVNVSGNKLSQAPEFTANIGVSYQQYLPDIGTVTYRMDYYHSTEKYFNEFNRRAVQDDYELINARISYTSVEENWVLDIYGKNLTDELVYTAAFDGAFFFGEGLLTNLAPPRTYGVQLTYKF